MKAARFTGDRPAYPSADQCPDVASHTPHPKSYLGFQAWAEKKLKTHTQEQCPTCGYWAIWVRRTGDPTSSQEESHGPDR